jgi:hypothetical protein
VATHAARRRSRQSQKNGWSWLRGLPSAPRHRDTQDETGHDRLGNHELSTGTRRRVTQAQTLGLQGAQERDLLRCIRRNGALRVFGPNTLKEYACLGVVPLDDQLQRNLVQGARLELSKLRIADRLD